VPERRPRRTFRARSNSLGRPAVDMAAVHPLGAAHGGFVEGPPDGGGDHPPATGAHETRCGEAPPKRYALAPPALGEPPDASGLPLAELVAVVAAAPADVKGLAPRLVMSGAPWLAAPGAPPQACRLSSMHQVNRDHNRGPPNGGQPPSLDEARFTTASRYAVEYGFTSPGRRQGP
jgi:hypothetical protein